MDINCIEDGEIMKNKTMFSIIVPVYNVEKYLDKCLFSITKQLFSDFEVILINDGSTDNSKSICENYAERYENVKVVNKENEGLASARNTGIEIASGEYLIFVDSDDYIADKLFLFMLEKAVRLCHPNVICYGWTREKNKKWINTYCYDLDYINDMNSEERLYGLISRDRFSISAWSHAIDRAFLVRYRCYFKQEYKTGEDIEWFFNVLSKDPLISGCNSSAYIYRIRENSITTTEKKSGFWKYRERAIRVAITYIDNSRCSESYKNACYGCLAYMFVILLAEIGHEPILEVKNNAMNKNKDLLWLINYAVGKKTVASSTVLKILGYKFGSYILSKRIK